MKTRKEVIPFTRFSSGGVEDIIIVEFTVSARLRRKSILPRLSIAVTEWVRNTDLGARVWDMTSEHLNIYDLMGHDRQGLGPILRQLGIHKLREIPWDSDEVGWMGASLVSLKPWQEQAIRDRAAARTQ